MTAWEPFKSQDYPRWQLSARAVFKGGSMHAYLFNIKTFDQATRHLTRVERSLYRDLIDLYYDTERPLTAVDFDHLARRVLAKTDEEKAALQCVLDEFFERTGDVYSHDYIDNEIERYKANNSQKSIAGKASAEARRKKAEERKRQRASKSNGDLTHVEHTLNTRSTAVQNHEQETMNHEQETMNHNTTAVAVAPLCGFDDFYSAYPKKVGRDDALKAWKKLSPSPELINHIIADIGLRVERGAWCTGKGKAYIPGPAPYLNQKKWMDEIIPRPEFKPAQDFSQIARDAEIL
jgi:uncharacterized protein YdaU (DUF1376 family)